MAGITTAPRTTRSAVLRLLRRCVAAQRRRQNLAQLRRPWAGVAERAGIDAVLVDVECTFGATVLTVELPPDVIAGYTFRDRIAAAMPLAKPYSLYVVKDPTNPRQVRIHHILDPWADARELAHPLMSLVTAMHADTEQEAV